MLINTVKVSIKRDTNIIVNHVNQYEVDILKAIHGDDDRCIVDENDIQTIEVDLDVSEEFVRLSDKYRRDSGIFTNIYRNEAELRKAIQASVASKKKVAEEVEEDNDGEEVVIKKSVPKKVTVKKQAKVKV